MVNTESVKQWVREKLVEIHGLLDRHLCERVSYTLYWNGTNINTNVKSQTFDDYQTALSEFNRRVEQRQSRYVELTALKKDKSIETLLRLSY